MVRISTALAQALADRGLIDPAELPKGRSKFGNEITEVDGIRFDSALEARRFCELRLMQREGLISDLWIQPGYCLQEAFKSRGKRHREIRYIGDFQYVENGRVVVEDTKGHETKDFKIKAKLFQKLFPEIELRIVR